MKKRFLWTGLMCTHKNLRVLANRSDPLLLSQGLLIILKCGLLWDLYQLLRFQCHEIIFNDGGNETSFDSIDSVYRISLTLEFDFMFMQIYANGSFHHCTTRLWVFLTANPLLAQQSLTPNHFLFHEPALSRCQIKGTCKSTCLLWTENAGSHNDSNKTEHQLGWFTQIWGNFSRSKSCKNEQFVKRMVLSPVWIWKMVDRVNLLISLEGSLKRFLKKTWTNTTICTKLYFRQCSLYYPVNIVYMSWFIYIIGYYA